MFAIESKKEDINKPESNSLCQSALTEKILCVYKRLKAIAKAEFSSKSKFKLAQLSQDKLNKLKNIETNMGYCLIAYEDNFELLNKKVDILNRINSLLNQYSKLSNTTSIKDTPDDFNKFFE